MTDPPPPRVSPSLPLPLLDCFSLLGQGGHLPVGVGLLLSGEGGFRVSSSHLLFSECLGLKIISVTKWPEPHALAQGQPSPLPTASGPGLTLFLALPTVDMGSWLPHCLFWEARAAGAQGAPLSAGNLFWLRGRPPDTSLSCVQSPCLSPGRPLALPLQEAGLRWKSLILLT